MSILEMHRRDKMVRETQACWYFGRNCRSHLRNTHWDEGQTGILSPQTGNEWQWGD